MKDLATAAGVTPGLAYHYFESKEALLSEVFARYSFLGEMRDIVAAGANRGVRDVLHEVVVRFSALLAGRTPVVRVILREAMVNPAIAAQLAATMDAGVTTLAEYLQTQTAAGLLRPHDTRTTARALLSTVFLGHVVYGNGNASAEGLVDVLLAGIAPDEAKEG